MTDNEGESASRAYLRSLIETSQLQDAIEVAKQLIERRGAIEDSIVAEYIVTLARLQLQVGANFQAEMSFSKADALYEALGKQSTSRAADAQQAMRDHAAFRRARGDAAGAAELERRAPAISVPDSSQTALRSTRRLDDITIVESKPALITAEDLQQIRLILAPQRVWWISVADTVGAGVGVQACLEPDIVTAAFHRGTCIFLAKATATSGWSRGKSQPLSDEYSYMRVPLDGTDASALPPIKLDPDGTLPLPPDEAIVDAIRLLRKQAVSRPNGRQKNDVQPWPVELIWVAADNQLILFTRNAEFTRGQMITLKRQGDGWEIVEMR